jgi:hypothetical protein
MSASTAQYSNATPPKIGDRVQIDGLRHYVTPAGILPSVTTILGSTKVEGERLAAWRDQASEVELAEVEFAREDGAIRGTAIHEAIERYAATREPPNPASSDENERIAAKWWPSLAPALRKVDRWISVERFVFSSRLGVAGTLDAFVEWCGTPVVADWKTAHKRKRKEWLSEHFTQLAAYRALLRECGEDCRGGVLVHAYGGASRPRIDELGANDLLPFLVDFRRRVDLWYCGGEP